MVCGGKSWPRIGALGGWNGPLWERSPMCGLDASARLQVRFPEEVRSPADDRSSEIGLGGCRSGR